MHTGIVIQARLSSTRFPNKILQKINGDTLLDGIIRNVSHLQLPIVLALPDNEVHRALSLQLPYENVNYFFGSEKDVLDRFCKAAQSHAFDNVIRICSDNPFLNIAFLNELQTSWEDGLDYCTYFNSQNVPAMKTHYGLFAEMISVKALEEINNKQLSNYFREHVTPFFYEHQHLFSIKKLQMPEPFFSGIPLRLTLDTPEDLHLIRHICANVNAQNPDGIIAFCEEQNLLSQMEEQIQINTK